MCVCAHAAPCACLCTENVLNGTRHVPACNVDGHCVRRRQIGLDPEEGLAVGGQVRRHNHRRTRHRRNSHTVSGFDHCRGPRSVASVCFARARVRRSTFAQPRVNRSWVACVVCGGRCRAVSPCIIRRGSGRQKKTLPRTNGRVVVVVATAVSEYVCVCVCV